MEQEAILLGYSGYDFARDGKLIKGAKLSYVVKNSVNEENKVGNLPIQVQFDLDILKQIPKFPCLAILKFGMLPNSKNQPMLQITSLSYVEDVDFSIFFKN